MDVRAVAVVDGTTLAIGPAGHGAQRRGQLAPGLQLVPAEPVEHQEHAPGRPRRAAAGNQAGGSVPGSSRAGTTFEMHAPP